MTTHSLEFIIAPVSAIRLFRYLLITLSVLIAVCYATVFYRLQSYALVARLLGAGQSAPNFTLPRVTGPAQALTDLRGQPVLLTFADLTCEVSLAQLTALEQFATGHPDVATVVIFQQSHTAIAERIAPNDYPHVQLLSQGETTFSAYGVYRTPTNFVIDPTGLIRYVQVGGQSRAHHFESYLQFLNVVSR